VVGGIVFTQNKTAQPVGGIDAVCGKVLVAPAGPMLPRSTKETVRERPRVFGPAVPFPTRYASPAPAGGGGTAFSSATAAGASVVGSSSTKTG